MNTEKEPAAQHILSVEYQLKLKHNGRRKKTKAIPKKPLKKLPHVTRLLALAHHLHGLIDQGIVNNYADIACLSSLSRARLSQIMNLTLLAPKIQEEILSFSKSSFLNIKEQNLRKILKTPVWREQYMIWNKLKDQ